MQLITKLISGWKNTKQYVFLWLRPYVTTFYFITTFGRQIELEWQLDAELRRQRRPLVQACEPLPATGEHSDQHQGQQHAAQASRLRLASVGTEHRDRARHVASDALVALQDDVAVAGDQEGAELSRSDSAADKAKVCAMRIMED